MNQRDPHQFTIPKAAKQTQQLMYIGSVQSFSSVPSGLQNPQDTARLRYAQLRLTLMLLSIPELVTHLLGGI